MCILITMKTTTSTTVAKTTKLTKEQRAEVKSLIDDSGYSRSDAVKLVLAGG